MSKDFSITVDTVNRYEEDLSLQVLPDFYPEHTNLAMNKKRRISVSYDQNQKKITLAKIFLLFGFLGIDENSTTGEARLGPRASQ